MKLERQAAVAHRLDIAIAGQKDLSDQRLDQLGPALSGVGPRQKRQCGVFVIAASAILQHQGQRRRRL